MKEEVYENYSGVFADRRAADLKDNENEDIYANEVPETQVTRSNNGSNTDTETITSGFRCFRLAVFSLLMLVVLLLAVVTILCVKMNTLIIERDQLETSFSNLTIQRDELKKHFNNLNTEKSQIEMSFSNLIIERDQLKNNFNNLNTEKSQCEIRVNTLVVERDQLQTRFNNLNMEKSQLQTRFNNMAAEKERLSQLKKDIDTPGWRYFSSSIYYISTAKKSWSESRQDCKRRGADLVIINSREEQDFVDVWRRNKASWIGANDEDSEGNWKWVDGTKVINGFWNPHEPNNIGDEDCAASGYGSEKVNWNDVPCITNHFWICEKRLNM